MRSAVAWLSIVILVAACSDDGEEPTGSGGSGGGPAATSSSISSAAATSTTGSGGGGPEGWSIAFGQGLAAAADRVVVDSEDNILVSGIFRGTIALGESSISSASDGADAFIAKLDPNGAGLWALQLGTTAGFTRVIIANGPDDDIMVAGGFNGSFSLGGTDFDAGAFADVFAARWNRDGELLWVEHFACDEDAFVSDLAVDDAGNMVLGGQFRGTCDFGDFDMMAAIGDGYVVGLGPDGVPTWSRAIGGAATGDSVSGVSIDDDGNVTVSGQFRDATDFGDGATETPDGVYDLYLARYDAGGAHLSHSVIPWEGTGYLDAPRLEGRGSGDAVVTGQYLSVTLDGMELTGAPKTNQIFVAGFDATTSVTMSAGFGGLSSEDHVRGVALGQGTVALVGDAGNIDFGGGTLGSGAGFVAVLNDDLSHIMSDRVSDTPTTAVEDVAIDSTGDLVIVGAFLGPADFGFGELEGNDMGAAFVVKRAVD